MTRMPQSRRTQRNVLTGVLAVSAGAAVAILQTAIGDLMTDRSARADIDRARCVHAPAPDDASSGTLARTAAEGGVALVSHGGSGRVTIVDLATGTLARLRTGLEDAHEVAVSPDGRWGVVAEFGRRTADYMFDGRRLAIVDLASRRVSKIIDLSDHRGPHDIAFLPGSSARVVVTTQTSRSVVEVDLDRGTVAAIPTGAVGSHVLAVADDGRTVFTANQPDGSISRLNLATRRHEATFQVGVPPVEGLAAIPGSNELLAGSRGSGELHFVDGANGATRVTLPGFDAPDRIAASADGRLALVSDFGCRTTVLVDLATRQAIGAVKGMEEAGLGRFLPDRRTALVALLDAGELHLVDLATLRATWWIDVGARIEGVGWGPAVPQLP